MMKIVVEDTARFVSDIKVKKPVYMSDEEFTQHVTDARTSLGEKGIASDLENKLSEMGFEVTETESNYPKFPDRVKSVITEIVDVGNDA